MATKKMAVKEKRPVFGPPVETQVEDGILRLRSIASREVSGLVWPLPVGNTPLGAFALKRKGAIAEIPLAGIAGGSVVIVTSAPESRKFIVAIA